MRRDTRIRRHRQPDEAKVKFIDRFPHVPTGSAGLDYLISGDDPARGLDLYPHEHNPVEVIFPASKP